MTTTTTTRGGPRPNAGRPTAGEGKRRPQSVTLSVEQREKALRVGEGSISEGVRRALDAYVEPARQAGEAAQ